MMIVFKFSFFKIYKFYENFAGMTVYVMGVYYNSIKCRLDPRIVQIIRRRGHLGSG